MQSISSPYRSEGSPTNSSGEEQISYEEIISNELTSHRHFDVWRKRLFEYLRQEGLEHVILEPAVAPVGPNPLLQERTTWIQRTVNEAKVKSILLHTIPLGNFKANKGLTARDIYLNVARECEVSARPRWRLPGGGRKGSEKQMQGKGNEATHR